ncbi:MAG: HEAT repeat domain-containing protein [Kofleriaceae bacterium]|nr:HEAT repeat domain-containing protein [Myxococcales bacterium]MCB9560425.1 HEAT repeat domain-containing protein [Kofleriaceae bacterium]MCB9571645.1 HEAT repeat domain-containing protein [Kofleriaceae bacterium]
MRRGLIALVVAMAVMIPAAPARADAIDDQIETLDSASSYKVRLSAALGLSKVADDRAVVALATALRKDREASVRRVAALGLKKLVTTSTAKSARDKAIAALEKAAADDKDRKVRKTAGESLATLRDTLSSRGPAVFVNVDAPKDQSKKASSKALTELGKVVKAQVRRASKDYETEWSGALPTGDELDRLGTQAFIVASSVSQVTITKKGRRADVKCTVTMRVAPWGGKDGSERWSANQTGTATGSAMAQTGATDAQIADGVLDCVAAVGEELTAKQVVPFIKRLASSR